MSDEELAFWQAKWRLEMWGDKLEWVRHASAQALLANTNRDPKRSPFKPDEFLPEDL